MASRFRTTPAILAVATITFITPSCLLWTPDDDRPIREFRQKLDTLAPQLLAGYLVPGMGVAILRDGEIAWIGGYGCATRASRQPVLPSTVFNVGSISKAVAAWGVMRLVEEGKLDLDAPVERYLKRWTLPPSEFDRDKVTLRRLLSHTAGISLQSVRGFHPGDRLPSIEEDLSSNEVRVVVDPGTEFRYSGGGYSIVQLVVEEVTGQSFFEFMRDDVLRPLGLSSSSFLWDDLVDSLAATPYDNLGDPHPGRRFTGAAAAGLQMSVEDLARFARASFTLLPDGQEQSAVLTPESLALMQTHADESPVYGLGYFVQESDGVSLVGHAGSNTGWVALFEIAPETGDGIVTAG